MDFFSSSQTLPPAVAHHCLGGKAALCGKKSSRFLEASQGVVVVHGLKLFPSRPWLLEVLEPEGFVVILAVEHCQVIIDGRIMQVNGRIMVTGCNW